MIISPGRRSQLHQASDLRSLRSIQLKNSSRKKKTPLQPLNRLPCRAGGKPCSAQCTQQRTGKTYPRHSPPSTPDRTHDERTAARRHVGRRNLTLTTRSREESSTRGHARPYTIGAVPKASIAARTCPADPGCRRGGRRSPLGRREAAENPGRSTGEGGGRGVRGWACGRREAEWRKEGGQRPRRSVSAALLSSVSVSVCFDEKDGPRE
jgi:hypothetical protein